MAVKILVVDDSATMRKIMEMTFAGENAEVVTVDNGDAAIQRAADLRPNVVFADVSMSGSDGYAVSRAVKSNPALAETAVILLASQHSAFDEAKARDTGVDDHVLKPFDTQALIDKLQDVLGRPRVRLAGVAAAAPAAPPVQTAPAPAAPPSAPGPSASFSRPAAPSAAAAPPPPPGARPAVAVASAAAPMGSPVRKPTVAFGAPPVPQSGGHSAAPPIARPSRPVLELAEDAIEAPRAAAIESAPRSPTQPLAAARPAAQASPVQQPKPSPVATPASAPRAPSAASPTATQAAARPSVAAAVSANGQMAKRLSDLGLTKDQIDGVLALSKEIVEQVVWEVVPELAETLIKEEIRRLTAE